MISNEVNDSLRRVPASDVPTSSGTRRGTSMVQTEALQWFEQDTADAYKLLAAILLLSIGLLILRLV